MTIESKNIFLTGITGTLGKEILKSLLQESNDTLYILIRPKNGQSHSDRARKILTSYGLEKFFNQRVKVVAGDITQENLGLSDKDREELKNNVQEVFHIAALTALNGTKDDCYRINIGGTEHVLELVEDWKENGALKRFFYFSTAFVAGSLQTFCAPENSLPENPAHANHYEASKYRAETKVREAQKRGLNVTIFRPSIVVGHSKTGEVSEFNVIYPFMKLFAHGIITKMPTRLDNSFNIVPIDFVVKAALTIARQETSIGKTFHLVTQNPPSIGMLLQVKNNEYPNMPHIEVVDPETFKPDQMEPQEQLVYAMLEPYLGYLNDHLSFETKNTEEALKGTGIEFPKTDYEFLNTLTQYAVDSGYLMPQ